MIKTQKILLLVLIAVLSFIFLNYLAVSLSNLAYPYDVEQSEGVMLPRIKFLLTGNPEYLYNSIYSYPYYFTNDYPPTFYFITAFFSLIFGEGFFSGRLLSFLSSLLISVFIFKIVKKETKNNYLGLVSSLLFFSSCVTFYWGSIYRNDMMGAMFSILGIYFLLYRGKNKKQSYSKNKNLLLSLIFFILAVTTKQTYIIAPLSSFVYLLFVNRKRSYQFLLLFILPTALLFLLLNFLTQGQFFLHAVIYNSKMTFSQNAKDLFFNFFTMNPIILIFSIEFFSRKKTKLISIYFLISVLFGILQVSKTGGATNYFIEPMVVMSIILGLLLGLFQKKEKIFAFFVILLLLQLSIYFYFDRYIVTSIFEPEKYFATRNLDSDLKVLEYIENNEGNVFIQNSMYMKANDDVLYELWGVYDIPENYINITRFEEYFKNKNYTLMFTNEHFYVFPSLVEYVEENYNLVDRINWYDNDYKELGWEVYRVK